MKLNCEQLETRENPAIAVSYGHVGSIVDFVRVDSATRAGLDIILTGDAVSGLTIHDNQTDLDTLISPEIMTTLDQIDVHGSPRSDSIVNRSEFNMFAVGNGGNDFLEGGPAQDVLIGGQIEANGLVSDPVKGSTTFVEAFPSQDVMIGVGAINTFYAYGGNDKIYTGKGKNIVYAEVGPTTPTTIYANYGSGVIVAGAGVTVVDPTSNFIIFNV